MAPPRASPGTAMHFCGTPGGNSLPLQQERPTQGLTSAHKAASKGTEYTSQRITSSLDQCKLSRDAPGLLSMFLIFKTASGFSSFQDWKQTRSVLHKPQAYYKSNTMHIPFYHLPCKFSHTTCKTAMKFWQVRFQTTAVEDLQSHPCHPELHQSLSHRDPEYQLKDLTFDNGNAIVMQASA